jgi:hypothetical protein
MRPYIIIALLLSIVACNTPKQQPAVLTKTDTVYLPTRIVCDTFYTTIIERDTVFIAKNDSLVRRLNTATYRLARVKHYVRICNRNPSQDKFLRGWLNRVIN